MEKIPLYGASTSPFPHNMAQTERREILTGEILTPYFFSSPQDSVSLCLKIGRRSILTEEILSAICFTAPHFSSSKRPVQKKSWCCDRPEVGSIFVQFFGGSLVVGYIIPPADHNATIKRPRYEDIRSVNKS